MSDVITIQGAKAGQEQPSRPSIADDTIASISRLKMVIGLSEGEVKGLANGAKSIMLEGTPLEDENGNQNFEGVEWEIRHGTVDQTYIAGMPNASSEIGIGVTVRSDTPWIRSITDTQLSSINVNLSFPLLKQVTDKGEVKGVSVDYVIEVQTDGNGYVPVVTKSLTAKTSGRYQRTHNVTLPDAQSNWQIRVRKITADGDNESLFNTMQVDSIAEVIDGKFNYPHTAHLYLSFDARTFSNIPKVSIDMLGVYVQVPTNYDTDTRTSTGIWNGQFKLGYTTNPAWHYYNLITNDRYGLGDKLQAFMIDKWALEHIARICDEPVDDGKGGTEPRFECNLYLQKAEDAYQVLQHVAGIFRGMSFWNGSKIFVDADTPRDCEYVITRANVVGGAFSKSGSAASDRHTIAQVAWSNPDNAYETEYAMVRNERAIAQQGINVLDLAAVGCTSEGQAYRMGLAALLAEQNRTQTVSFAMGLDGSLPTVGSRIDIPDMMFTGANSSGRISSVNANRTVITVDRDNVPATVGDKLMVNLESGKAQSRVITAINDRAIAVALAFDPVAPENVWSIISDELPTMPFIVMSVTSAEDGTQYNYTAMQYDPTMYAQIDNGTIIEQRPPVPSNNPYIIDAPDTVTLSSRHRVAQGITVTTLEITWSQVTDAVAYDVEWRKDDGDWIKLPRTGNISAEIDGIYSGNYLARVRAVSAFDAISKPATSMLTAIVGKVGLPPVIVGLTATGVLFGMDLKWSFGTGSGDSDYTEVQVGSAPDVNVAPLTQASYPTNTHTVTGLQGNLSQSYRARLVDKLGNKSAWSTWVTATTDASADKVLDLIEGQINESSLNAPLTTKIDKIGTIEGDLATETQQRIADIIETKQKADAAQTAATNAATLAGNKGEVIYQSQTPAAARQLAQNLWIDTTGGKNTPKRWDGSAWVVVTDKAATDAQTAATKAIADAKTADDKAVAAQGTANTAKTDAKTADDKAVAAQQSATAALSSLSDISSDNKLTAVEKQQVKLIFDDIQRTHADVLNRAAKYSVSTSEYTSAYNDLSSYITPKLSDMSSTSTIVRASFNTKFDTLFLKRADLDTAIVNAAKLVATNAQATATEALGKANTASQNIVTILDEQQLINNELGVQYETLQGVILDYKPEYFDKTKYFSSQAQNWTYAKTVARDNYAMSERITNLQSDVADSNATFTQSFNTLATKDEALASSITALNAKTGQNTSAIASEITARTNADSALSTRVDTVQSSTATAQATATEALGKANTATSNIATIQTELTATTSKTNATASSVTTLQTTVGDNTASIQTSNTVINGLSAQSTTLLDVNGKVVGVGTYNDGKTGEFAVYADNINFLPPKGGDDGVSQLVVRNTSSVIDGVTVPAGLYTRNFYAPRASIDTIQIKDAAIKSAQIGSAQVDTLQLKGEAVTVPRLTYIPNPKVILKDNTTYNGTKYALVTVSNPPVNSRFSFHSWTFEAAKASFDPMGGAVSVQFSADMVYTNIELLQTPLAAPQFIELQVRRLDLSSPLRVKRTAVADVIDGKLKIPAQTMTLPTILDSPPMNLGSVTYVAEIVFYASADTSGGRKDFRTATNHEIGFETASCQILGVKR